MSTHPIHGTLLTIGDELLIGQVINSNVSWMSEKLTQVHCTVSKHLTVGDRETEITQALDYLLTDSDFIILGGGLGPTHDDITLEVLSRYFSLSQEYDSEWIQKVEEYFKARNRVMSENNKKQGYLLKGATRIDNDCGTAAGQHFTVNQNNKSVDIFVVPGVPHEMKSMMERYILPTLSKKTIKSGEKILQKTILTTGIGESALSEKCASFVKKIQSQKKVSLAFLPSSTQVRLRLQTIAANPSEEKHFEDLVQELKTACGKDFFGFDQDTIEKQIVEHLIKAQQTVALAESCTGGLVSRLLTRIPGSSQVFRGSMIVYQEHLKTSELSISPETIQTHGVVSEIVAKQMAEAIRKRWNTSFGVGTTGYLGPSGGDAFAKVGTIWIAVATETETITKQLHFENLSNLSARERNQERAAQAALDLLRRSL